MHTPYPPLSLLFLLTYIHLVMGATRGGDIQQNALTPRAFFLSSSHFRIVSLHSLPAPCLDSRSTFATCLIFSASSHLAASLSPLSLLQPCLASLAPLSQHHSFSLSSHQLSISRYLSLSLSLSLFSNGTPLSLSHMTCDEL